MTAAAPHARRRRAAARSSALLAALALVAGCGGEPTLARGDADALAVVEAARERWARGDVEGAYEALAFAAPRHAASLELALELASAAEATQRRGVALDGYEAVLAADPTEDAAGRGAARCALFLGRHERAEAAAELLLALPVPSANDLATAARVAHERGDPVAAEARARLALERDPDHANARYWLAQAHLARDETDAAVAELERVVALDPGHIAAGRALGTALLQRGDEARGRTALAAADASQAIGQIDFLGAPAEERVARAAELAAAVPQWSWPWVEKARAELELGRTEAADRSLAQAEARRPETAESARLRVQVAAALGRNRAVRRWMTKWEERRGDDPR